MYVFFCRNFKCNSSLSSLEAHLVFCFEGEVTFSCAGHGLPFILLFNSFSRAVNVCGSECTGEPD